MGSLSHFLQSMDWMNLSITLLSAVAALFCITFHELSHGFVAYRLGDPTAKNMGRLTFNPLKHIDPIGLLMMITVRVGWAKPVPVDMRNFKKPKRDMAITALAGPVSNFFLSWVALLIASALFHLLTMDASWMVYVVLFFLQIAVLSVGLGVFNLIPISPLDGSKILFSFLPDRVYGTILHYERYGMVLMVILAWSGIMNGPLTFVMGGVMRFLCTISGFPFGVVQNFFF
ncbi:MAG: site-2 protease family protein [Oscillospiraceae bacterium]